MQLKFNIQSNGKPSLHSIYMWQNLRIYDLRTKKVFISQAHVPVFLYQSQLSSQQPPHSFWCTLYYQTELEPICFCPSLSHHTRIFLQASLCLLTTFIAPLGSTVLMSIPASVDISRREAEINPCTKHENNPPPISVSV